MTTCIEGLVFAVCKRVRAETYRVKDDAEFEHQESSDLLLVGLVLRRFEFFEDDRVFYLVHVVTESSMRGATGARNVLMVFLLSLDHGTSPCFNIIVLQDDRQEVARIRMSVADRSTAGSDDVFDALIILLAIFGFDISLREKVHQEDNHDRYEYDSRWPGVHRPAASHTNTSLRTIQDAVMMHVLHQHV
jgi:hypothetical protein